MTVLTQVQPGAKGFDVNVTVSPEAAAVMVASGYSFVLRYVPRILPVHPHDLSAGELHDLLEAGLLVGAVQHVESESSWLPTADKGSIYGQGAVAAALPLGLEGTTLWCDLEGITVGTPWTAVDDYCRAWYAVVKAAGFEPGLYVGWHAGLDASQLYHLPFNRYWGALNLDADQFPAVRGLCMKQHEAKPGDDPANLGIDTDTVMADLLGGLPTMLGATGLA